MGADLSGANPLKPRRGAPIYACMKLVALLAGCAALALSACYTGAAEAAPVPRTLLVAVDTVTGSVRGLYVASSEEICLSKLKGTAWAEYHDVRPTERMECRVPK